MSNNDVKTEKEIDQTSTNSADNSDQEDSGNNSDKSDISNKSEKRIIKEEKTTVLQISKKIENHLLRYIIDSLFLTYKKNTLTMCNLYFFR